MNKQYYVVTIPENGWDCIVGIYLAYDEEAVWKHLASQNIGDTVKGLKEKHRHVIHKQYQLEEL